MAQLALTVGGSVLGNYLLPGIGGVIGASVGAVAGGFIDSLWMSSGQKGQQPYSGDKKVTADSYGQPFGLPFGTIRISGIMIWSSNLIAKTEDDSVGGGMGFGTPSQGVTNVTTYSASFMIALGERTLLGDTCVLLRLWGDGKPIYDARVGHGKVHGRGAVYRFYPGGSTQQPDPKIQAHDGLNYVPANRELITVMVEHMQLADFGNRIPNITAEISIGAQAYPFQTVDPGAGSHFSDDTAINLDAQTILKIDADGIIVKVDLQTVSTLFGPIQSLASLVGMGNSVFGPDGFLYSPQASFDTPGAGTFNFEPWSQIDPQTLQVVQQVGFVSHTFDSPTFNGLGLTEVLKCRGIPYLLGVMSHSLPTFTSVGIAIVSLGLLEQMAGSSGAGAMRFVGKTEASGGPDPAMQDAEIDIQSIVNVGSPTSPVINFTAWGIWGDSGSSTCNLYKWAVTDNFLQGGGASAGGANGANPIILVDTIDLSGEFSVNGACLMTYDDDTHSIIIVRGSKAIRFNLDTETVTGAELEIGGATGSETVQGPINGTLYAGAPGGQFLNLVDVSDWLVSETVDLHNFDGSLALSSQKYEPDEDAIWIRSGSAFYKLFLHRVTSDQIELRDIVTDLCGRVGLDSSLIDVSALTDVVRGYVVARQSDIRSAIQPLQNCYFFDAVESDFKIKFPKRGAASTLTLDKTDLGAYEYGGQRPDPLTYEDLEEQATPRRIYMKYIEYNSNYQDGAQSDERSTDVVAAIQEQTVDVPVVFTSDEAKEIVEMIMEEAWTNRRSFKFTTSRKFLKMDPADPITVTKDGHTLQMRPNQIDFGANGMLEVSAFRYDPDVYVPTSIGGVGGGSGGVPPNPISLIGHTDVEQMDIVMLRDSDNSLGWYAAAAPDSGDPDDWIGGLLLRSVDNGNSYTTFVAFFLPAAVMGRTTAALAAPRAWTTWDRVSTLTVQGFPGVSAPASASELAVLNGANMALVGNEIIHFKNCTDNGDGTFTIDTLLRGDRGSDPYTGTHTPGERFVMLDFVTLKNVIESDLGLTRFYKTQSIGNGAIPAQTQLFTDTGNRLRPLTGQGPTLSAGGGGDLVIAWNRRTRIGGENDFADGVTSVPLGEAAESYQVDIFDGPDVVRTLTSTTPTVTYSAADQTTDFGGTQTSLTVAIYQMSEVVGRGFPLEADLLAA